MEKQGFLAYWAIVNLEGFQQAPDFRTLGQRVNSKKITKPEVQKAYF